MTSSIKNDNNESKNKSVNSNDKGKISSPQSIETTDKSQEVNLNYRNLFTEIRGFLNNKKKINFQIMFNTIIKKSYIFLAVLW